jgi:hypothetical protein
MTSNNLWRIKLVQILLGAAIVIALVLVRGTRAANESVHLTTDWSDHHLIFSAPHNFEEHTRLLSNPRYLQQLVRHNTERRDEGDGIWSRRWQDHPGDLHGDWSINMGGGATVGTGNYPAKFSFDATTVQCGDDPSPDFVVYNTSLAGSNTAIAAFDTGTFTGEPTAGQTITITNPNTGTAMVLTASSAVGSHTGSANSGTGTFQTSSNTTTQAANLMTSINIANNGSFVGVTASSNGAVLTVMATTAGTTGNSVTASETATGFTWTSNNFFGGALGQASIGAFDNLYSGCSGSMSRPSTYWAYNTGGTDVTSSVLSLDGTQVAFVQTVGTTANLVVLKWAASTTETFVNPMALTNQSSAGAYQSCPAPCMYSIPFSGGANDTNSSVFYDYASDTIYVGDNSGLLHKFTGIFSGSPSEVTATWPVALGTTVLTSPVYDSATGKVYVADGLPTIGGGRLWAVTSATGAKIESAQLSFGVGFISSPLVDSTNAAIYLFSADSPPGCPGSTTHNIAIEISERFIAGGAANGSSEISATVATCSTTVGVQSGYFDNLYLSGGAGNIYVCGNMSTTTAPTLYQVALTSAGLITGSPAVASAGPVLAAVGNQCGPVTEVYNPGIATDWIFTSVQGGAVTGGVINCPAAAGCIMSFNVTAGTVPTATVGHAAAAGGASGVIIDNTVGPATLAGASQLYFTPLTNQTCTTSGVTGGCAIQASQAAIN